MCSSRERSSQAKESLSRLPETSGREGHFSSSGPDSRSPRAPHADPTPSEGQKRSHVISSWPAGWFDPPPPGLLLKRLSDLAGGQLPPATDFGYSKALANQPRRRSRL